jgi:hypothetical protein
MLGSMLTNLLFVFGIACVVGGTRWQVQELRITSGNVSVGLLLVSVAASVFPAALIMSGQLRTTEEPQEKNMPSKEELQFSRINAFVMVFLYCCYLIFQLGTHKEEFDEDDNVVQAASGHELHLAPHFTSRHGRQTQARRNLFCKNLLSRICRRDDSTGVVVNANGGGDVELSHRHSFRSEKRKESQYSGLEHGSDDDDASDGSSTSGEVLDLLTHDNLSGSDIRTTDDEASGPGGHSRATRRKLRLAELMSQKKKRNKNKPTRSKSHDSDFYPDFAPISPTSLSPEPEHGKCLPDLI